jgi:nickel transport protein
MIFKKLFLSGLSGGIMMWIITYSPQTFAHGSKITYQSTQGIEITAKYENDTPMRDAQVVIYAPDDPATPWLKGLTNEEGKFMFIPNSKITGNWSIKVRFAGHGTMINIPIESSEIENSNEIKKLNISNQNNNPNLTTLQKLMMSLTGIWGLIGTALFFSRKS